LAGIYHSATEKTRAKDDLLTIISICCLHGQKLGKGEPGYDLVNSKCGHCHFTGVKKAHATKEEWDKTVTKMIGKGAKLDEAEKATVVDFLVKYYHP
jgi:cytochrome c5